MAKMNGSIDWDDVAPEQSKNGSNNGRGIFLYLKTGNTYRVRLVGGAVVFHRIFHKPADGKPRTAICEDPKNCSVLDLHKELKSQERYAIYVIDRADNKLKIMEGPKTLFLYFKQRYQSTKVKPGGPQGGDWEIKITGTGLMTKYTAIYLDPTPFTDDEKAILSDEFRENRDKLAKMFTPLSDEDIEKKLFTDIPTTNKKQMSISSENNIAEDDSSEKEESDFDLDF